MNARQLEQHIANIGNEAAATDDLTALTARVAKLEAALVIALNSSPDGNDVALSAADYQNVNGRGGNLTLKAGAKNGTGLKGQILFPTVPTADPHVVNALWSNAGAATISAG